MGLSSISSLGAQKNIFSELDEMRSDKLRNMLKDEAEQGIVAQHANGAERAALAEAGAEARQNDGSAHSDNVMQRNFTSRNREQSKYVKHATAGQQAEKSFGDRMNSLVSVISSEIATAVAEVEARGSKTGAAGRAYAKMLKAKSKVAGVIQEEIQKKSEKHLKETREDIESKAQEALAPTDAQGNPIIAQDGEVPVIAPGTGSQAPVPDAAPATQPDVPLTGEAAVQAAPVAQASVNIVI